MAKPAPAHRSPEELATWLMSPAGLAVLVSQGRWRPAKHLLLLNRYLVDIAAGRLRRLIVMMPPRHGKSELVSRYLPAWYLGTFPDRRVILCSYEADFAASWGRKARDLLEEHGPSLWGIRVRSDSSAANRWDLAGHDGGMVTAGVGGPITGRGAHLLVIDDPVKNREEAESPTIRERIWSWWTSTAATRLEPGGAAVLVMTRWHEDDLAGRLLRQQGGEDWDGEPWAVVRLPALAEEDDPLGRRPGDPLWPERYDARALAAIRAQVGSYDWAALYQQRPTPAGGGIFRREWLRYYRTEQIGGETHYLLGDRRWPASACWRFAVADLAVSTKETADWTVVATWAVTPESDLLLLDVVRGRFEGPDQPHLIRTAFARWSPAYVGIEREKAGMVLSQQLLREGLPIRELRPDRDKVSRALAAAVRYEAGRVYHPESAPWLADWEAELLSFPGGAHDDQVDCAAYAALELYAPPAPEPQRPGLPFALRDPEPENTGWLEW